VVGGGAGDGRGALDGVQPVHGGALAAAHPPACREVTDVAQATGLGRHEIGVQRHDDVGGVEAVAHLEVAAERPAGPRADGVAVGRLVQVPARLRVGVEQAADLRRQGR